MRKFIFTFLGEINVILWKNKGNCILNLIDFWFKAYVKGQKYFTLIDYVIIFQFIYQMT